MEDLFTVRIPKDKCRKFSMMKFGTGSNIDFAKVGDQSVKMERENNLKEYKTANDLDMMPKFGAGSEYGRDQKEESRRKKYGIMLKKYNPDDQPWHLKIGSGKQAKRYKGVREGTISENTSYYIFTKAEDGAFEAFPVEEWYNFSPIVKYKYLNSDEAEEEFSKRNETLNLFSIMVRKRLKKEEDIADDDEEGTKGPKKTKKAKKDLILTDMEEWNDLDMSDDDDDDDGGDENDDEGVAKKKKKSKTVGGKKRVKNAKQNSDDEAVEESDEGDHDDREVDYMSDSGGSSDFSGPEADDKDKKYDEKGVDQEAGLRNILDSEAEEEEEEEEEAEKEEPEEEVEEKKEKKKGDENSSSSSSEDDSDIEKDAKLASAMFLQQPQDDRKSREAGHSSATSDKASSSQEKVKDKALKRKGEKSSDGKLPSVKRHKNESSEGISEAAIYRYLMRKPMSTKDLLTKFKAKKLNMSNERITNDIAQILKKINPERTYINKVLYWSLKKPE